MFTAMVDNYTWHTKIDIVDNSGQKEALAYLNYIACSTFIYITSSALVHMPSCEFLSIFGKSKTFVFHILIKFMNDLQRSKLWMADLCEKTTFFPCQMIICPFKKVVFSRGSAIHTFFCAKSFFFIINVEKEQFFSVIF